MQKPIREWIKKNCTINLIISIRGIRTPTPNQTNSVLKNWGRIFWIMKERKKNVKIIYMFGSKDSKVWPK